MKNKINIFIKRKRIFFLILAILQSAAFASGNLDHASSVLSLADQHQSARSIVLLDDVKTVDRTSFKSVEAIKIKYTRYFKVDSVTQNTVNTIFERNPLLVLEIDCGDIQELLYINNMFEIFPSAQKIRIVGPQIKKLYEYFLYKLDHVKEVDLSSMTNLEKVDDRFLSDCKNLEKVTLPNQTKITRLPNFFLAGSKNLKSINLNFLSTIQEIDSYFFSFSGITTVDLSALSSIVRIEHGFLEYCKDLVHVTFPSSSTITHIGDQFFYECEKLNHFDAAFLSNTQYVGKSFLTRCFALKTLDLRPLAQLTSRGADFIAGLNLDRVIVPQNWDTSDFPSSLRECISTNETQPVVNAAQRQLNAEANSRLLDVINSDPFILYSPSIRQIASQIRQGLLHPAAISQSTLNPINPNHPGLIMGQKLTVDPKRQGSDYTEEEMNCAAILMRDIAPDQQSRSAYVARLEEVFSTERALKILEDISNLDI